MPRIDAHHHLWKYAAAEYPWMTDKMDAIRRDFLPHDLLAVTAESGVEGTVAVQARQTLEETEWLLGLAAESDLIQAVVGWAPLIDVQVGRNLERFAGMPKLKAVRHVLHDESDDYYMLRADFNRGIALLKDFGLAYDLLVFDRHLPQTIQFVDRHPNQVFIVDHIAKPRIRERKLSPWREHISELAQRPNVFCKLSGLVTEANWSQWTDEELEPYIDLVLTCFGPGRVMFGSDWPVILVASSYARWIDLVLRLISRLSKSEQSQVMGRTAIRAYRIDPRGPGALRPTES